mmetsp:Transcript_3694/g.7905  ORF Transcript_3694/g.7905 Transcript_3694/m.7905 type:complete len:244 (-) Transcript_3694:26-757(-)
MVKSWCPLESNPDVMLNYISNLGFPAEQYTIVDILAVEDWAFQMVPQPVVALVLLFPTTDNYTAAKAAQAETLNSHEVSGKLFYMKQTIGNACGTIGLLHAIANIVHSEITQISLQIKPGSFLESYLEKAATMTPEERGHELEYGEESASAIEEAHAEAASEGQSAPIESGSKVGAHFVAIVPVEGNIYELDGRKVGPVNFGPYSCPEMFGLEAAEKVIKNWYMLNDPEEIRFGICAIVPKLD